MAFGGRLLSMHLRERFHPRKACLLEAKSVCIQSAKIFGNFFHLLKPACWRQSLCVLNLRSSSCRYISLLESARSGLKTSANFSIKSQKLQQEEIHPSRLPRPNAPPKIYFCLARTTFHLPTFSIQFIILHSALVTRHYLPPSRIISLTTFIL